MVRIQYCCRGVAVPGGLFHLMLNVMFICVFGCCFVDYCS